MAPVEWHHQPVLGSLIESRLKRDQRHVSAVNNVPGPGMGGTWKNGRKAMIGGDETLFFLDHFILGPGNGTFVAGLEFNTLSMPAFNFSFQNTSV